VPVVPDAPSAPDDPVAALRAANARLREVIEAKDELLAARDARIAALAAQVEALAARVAELERRLGRDSSNSSRPPSSDGPYAKKPRDRSLRERGKRRPGKQPGAQSSTLRQVTEPDETIVCAPPACTGCGADLGGADVTGMQRLQVFDTTPPPPPKVTEYQVQARACGRCGAVTAGQPPAGVTGRAQYGPEAHAQAANLVSGHHIPVHRATLLLCQLAGIAVSTGWMAGIRGKAAALVEDSGFMDRVAELLKSAPAVHADETPARAAAGTRYVHLACTAYLTHLHTGDRSAQAIDAGGVLPGYDGIIVRDGYAGYAHLTGALHAWCAVHLLRDLKGLYDFEPGKQEWAHAMATLLIQARDAASAARQAGQAALDAAVLDDLVTRYRALAAEGLAANIYRRTATAGDARRIARRFLANQDLILRFATRPDLDIFSNNEAERTIRPVKVQQRGSGGCWRTLEGLAEFALLQSYLSTAAKWGISKLDALRGLFNGRAWLPPGLEPAG
jgi:transposase